MQQLEIWALRHKCGLVCEKGDRIVNLVLLLSVNRHVNWANQTKLSCVVISMIIEDERAVCVNKHSSDAAQFWGLTLGCFLILLVLSSKLMWLSSVARVRTIVQLHSVASKRLCEMGGKRLITNFCFTGKTVSKKFDWICSWLWHHCACNTNWHSPEVTTGVWRLPYEAGARPIWVCHLLQSIYIKPQSVNTETHTSPWF